MTVECGTVQRPRVIHSAPQGFTWKAGRVATLTLSRGPE